MKKTFIISAVVLTLGVTGLGASHALAQDATYPSIVQRIADKFNLKPEDVQAVFKEEREERHKEMETRLGQRLDALVKEGKLTEEQKQAFLKKHEEMQKNFEENFVKFKEMSPEDRQEIKVDKKDDLKAWADEQGIDLKEVFGDGFGHRKFIIHP